MPWINLYFFNMFEDEFILVVNNTLVYEERKIEHLFAIDTEYQRLIFFFSVRMAITYIIIIAIICISFSWTKKLEKLTEEALKKEIIYLEEQAQNELNFFFSKRMKDLKVIKKKQNDLGSKRKKIQEILNSNKIDKINKKILESMLEDIGEKDVLLKEELQLL